MNKSVSFADLILSEPATPCVGVSVVVVVYRTGPALFTSIARVLDEPLVDDFVIVDNGSTPEDAARLFEISRAEPRIRLLQGHGNVGFARGANLGASAARGRFLVFLNPDAFLEPGCVAALRKACLGRASPCVAGARVMNEDGTEQRGARREEITPVTTLLTFTRLTHVAPFLRGFEIHRETEAVPDGVIETPVISGACFGVTREDFRKLKGFDGDYFLHVEDVDLCWRARGMGGTVVFQPEARVIHLGQTSRAEPFVVEWHKGRGLARYFIKRADNWPRRILAYALSPLIVGVSAIRPVMRKVTGRS